MRLNTKVTFAMADAAIKILLVRDRQNRNQHGFGSVPSRQSP